VKIPFPEFADFVYAISVVDSSLDLEFNIVFDKSEYGKIFDAVNEIEEAETREYFLEVVQKWVRRSANTTA
jgi:hypothetical protein